MKNLQNILGLLFLITILSIQSLQAGSPYKKVEVIDQQVDKKMSLLDHILYYIEIIRDEPHNTLAQGKSRAIISNLMKDKDLDRDIKNTIEDDIDIILNSEIKSELDAAYERLVDTYSAINAKAHVIDATVEATEMVQNASKEDLEETIAQAKQKIEQAEQEQGFMRRMYTKAKRFVTAPVDYVFGQEESYMKTAFYAAVGLAVLAAGAYGTYQYFDLANNDLMTKITGKYAHKELAKKIIDQKYPNMPEEMKMICVDYIDNLKTWYKAQQPNAYDSDIVTKCMHKDIEIEERLKKAYPNINIRNLTFNLGDLSQNLLFAEKYGKFSYGEALKELERLTEKYQKNPDSEIKNKISAFKYELWLRRGRRGGI